MSRGLDETWLGGGHGLREAQRADPLTPATPSAEASGPTEPPPSIADMAAAMIEALTQPAVIVDASMRVVAANRAFVALFGGCDLALPGDRHARERLSRGAAIHGSAECTVEVDSPTLGRRRFVLRAARLPRAAPDRDGHGRDGSKHDDPERDDRERDGPERDDPEGDGGTRADGLVALDDVTDTPSVPTPAHPAAHAGGVAAGVNEPRPPARSSRALAAAAHDLRQPLQAMTLLASLLARRVTDPSLLPLIGRLDDAVTVTAAMLTSLLDAERYDGTDARAAPADFSVNELFVALDATFAHGMRQNRMRWRVVPSARMVHTDQRMLARLLGGVIEYALGHCQDGRILLGARPRRQRLRVELWGAGDGLGEEEAASAIEAAQRALLPGTGDAHAPEPPPSLSVARRIADRLGHRIEVAARPGRGVVFSVDLPLVDAVAVRSAPRADLAARALPRPVMPSRGTVFVIDDDPFVRDTLRDVLEATGWTSETFASAEAFLAADRPDRSGCVVVDAMLPGISGLALLRTLRDQRQRLLPIMLTGAGDIRMAVEAMAAGALNFIEKPVRYEELLPIIERAFDTLADAGKAAVWREQARRRAASLTTRQRQILNLVLAGEPSRKIAAGLGVSRRTVENHRAIIMRKMGAESMPQLIRAGMAET